MRSREKMQTNFKEILNYYSYILSYHLYTLQATN